MDDQTAKFLEKIKMIESSGGIDTNHPEMTHGIHKGQSAYGSYGLMPNTQQEILNRIRLKSGGLDPDLQKIYKEDPDYVKAVLSARPDLEERLAQELAEKVISDSKGDEEIAAYKWNMGHNLPSDRITPEKLDNSEYVKRFRSLRQKLGAR